MGRDLQANTLIGLFDKSLASSELARKLCLEVLRTEREETLTFGGLKAGAQDFALSLIRGRGIRPGDKVAILGKNRADWDIALWGVILAGAVPVLIDPERPVEAVKTHLVATDARLLVTADDYQDAGSREELKAFTSSHDLGLIEMTGNLASSQISSAGSKPVQLLEIISAQIKPDDTAVILCTSGTTDDPREVELTHTNLLANIQGVLQMVKITPRDKLGHIIPPHHAFGFTVGKLLPLLVGATNVYTNRYRQISQIIRDKNITIFIGIPALFAFLARKIAANLAEREKQNPLLGLLDRYLPGLVGRRIIKKQGWQNLRFFLSGAAPLPKWVLHAFWRRGLELREGYGTTENSPVYGFNSNPRKLGSVGKPLPTLQVRIVNEKDQNLRPGEKGEIVLGGPCVMKGYYNNPKATEAVTRTDPEGVRWLYTGDLGYLDEEGDLFITGRKKYVIVLPGGKNVNPEFVESVLSQARYVRDILVVPNLCSSDFVGDAAKEDRNRQEDEVKKAEEAVRAIVQPAWDEIHNHTGLSYADLIRQPDILKRLIWQSINECQRKSRHLSRFEKVAPNCLEIKMDEFVKTSTGKIKRDLYINATP